MEIYILDLNFIEIMLIDRYTSMIWTDRYDQYGDFELHMPLNVDILSNIKIGYYVEIKGSDRTMIVEDISVDTDAENGITMTITGRSLESILDRRIVWNQTILNGKLDQQIKRILNENVISPSIGDRKIQNVIYQETSDSKITGVSVEAQFTGDNVYDVISALAMKGEAGFRMIRDSSNRFVFGLYSGTDRSYDQDENNNVIFSPEFGNILSSNMFQSITEYKNVTLVAGEGEGSERKTVTVGSGSGLDRRELYTDARDISSQTQSGTMPVSQYNAELKSRGEEKLKECKEKNVFEGEADYRINFIYGEDYFIGDIVQLKNGIGGMGRARIIETVISSDEQGYRMYPTFEMIEEE